jgi:hypothetical protein
MKQLPKLLSKTKIMRGYRCAKSIYLTIHNPELEPPVGPDQQAVFDQGNRVGELARTYYPGGVLVDNKPWDFGGSLKRTRELLKEGTEFIYEAAFEYKGCYARADILKYSKESKRWTLIEVKSGTKVKDEYLEDVGLQAWIIANSGVQLEKICILHLNPECRFPNLKNLFNEVDVTDRLRENYRDIAPRLNAIFNAIRSPEIPDVDIGPHCSANRDCEFKEHCFKGKGIPEVSVFDIPKLRDKVWEFYKKGQVDLKDVDMEDFSEAQKRMVQVHISGEPFVDAAAIRAAMADWKYPLVYLDFETVNPPIPQYPGTGPYQQVPFQFSVHIQRAPGGPLEHKEFLHDTGDDPRPGLIPALLEACGEEGTIVSYFATFEKKRIEEMAGQFKEHREELEALLPRFKDPLEIFRECVYDAGFKGSFSLKAVAPAILGESFSYEGMEVGDGTAAQRAFAELTGADTTQSRRESLRRAMLEYCEKDTLAMVEAVNWLGRQI